MGLWRVHVELEDRPGRLGDLAAAVGGSGCNIISLTVHGERGPDGTVTDELMVDARDEAAATALADRIRRADIGCTLAVPVLAGELRDPVSTALALARRVARNPDSAAAAVASLLHARLLSTGTQAAHIHRMWVLGREVRLGRSWPFTATEASRAAMLVEMAELNAAEGTDPHVAMGTVMLGDGSEVELRIADNSHAPLIAALHARCTPATRRARFLNPSPSLSPDELAELITGESGKGDSVVALTLDGGSVVGLVTVDPDGRGSASLSVLVEDSWQVRGVGTALIRRAVEVATDAGWYELVAQLVDGLLKVRIPLSMT
jgi:hypothetical protein